MADNLGNTNDQIEQSRLQSSILGYKRGKKLIQCGIIAISVLAILMAVFLTLGWNNYNAGNFSNGILPPSDGSFTVLLDPKDGTKSIAISETRGFANPTSNLKTKGLKNVWNTTLSKIPIENLDNEQGGAKNDEKESSYFAYTFFFKNTGTEALDYSEAVTLTENQKDAVKAMRIMICRDGEAVIYASPAVNGSKEPASCDESFTGDVNLISKTHTGLEAGQIVRYTIIVWFEGNDPECIDEIRGGAVELSLAFDIV